MSVVIQSGWAGGTYGPNNPRIGWNSTAKRGTVAASSEASGYAAANAASPLTYSYWRPTGLPATFEIETPTAETLNYCGIAAHNLGGTGCTVELQIHDGSSWVAIASVTPTDDSTIFFLFNDTSATRARVEVTGTLPPSIGVIAFGEALELPQRLYQGYTPIDLAEQAQFKTNLTAGGAFAGRSVQRMGARAPISISHVTEAWFRANMMDFKEESRARPFFLAERPQDYPTAVDYSVTEAEIMFERTGPKTYGSFTL